MAVSRLPGTGLFNHKRRERQIACRKSLIVIGTAHEIAAALTQQLALAACQALVAIRTEQHWFLGGYLMILRGSNLAEWGC